MEDYILHVCTENERESSMVRIGNKECLMAKNGSKFIVELTNAGDTACDVKLSIGYVFIHTWRINPQQTIKLRRHHVTKEEFQFRAMDNNSSRRLSTSDLTNRGSEVCRKTVVSAHFYPAKDNACLDEMSDEECLEDEVCQIPDKHIHWGKVINLSLDVIICDHYLQ